MIRISLLITCILLGIINSGCKKDTKKNGVLSIEDLVVKNNEITGWTNGSGWVATGGDELTTYIDGGSGLYLKYHFAEGANQLYNGTINSVNCEISLTVYNFSSSEDAAGLFEDPDLGLSSAQTWTDQPAGLKAKYIRYSGLSQVLSFYRGTYLVSLAVTYDSDESLSILKQFAYNVDEKLKKTSK